MGRFARWAGPGMLVLAGLCLLAWTWNAWPDLLIDGGREAYVPWRLAEGQVLYRDIAYFNGPVSAYVNAAIMMVAGPSLKTLFAVNLLVIVLITGFIYLGVSRLADRVTGALAGLAFLCLFCFGQLTLIDTNFMYPYSHEMTHGALLLALSCWLVYGYQRTVVFEGKRLLSDPPPEGDGGLCGVQPNLEESSLAVAANGHRAQFSLCARGQTAAASGVVMGLLFLVKPEVFVAGAVLNAGGYGLAWAQGLVEVRKAVRHVGLLMGGMLIAPMFAWGLLALGMSAGEAWHGMLGAWAYLGTPGLTDNLYFKIWQGTIYPWETARLMLIAVGIWVAVMAPIVTAAWLVGAGRSARAAAMMGGGIGLLAVVLAYVFRAQVPWLELVRPVPALLIFLVCVWGVRLYRTWGDAETSRVPGMMVVLSLFSLALALKLGFFFRVWHYGFVLAVPGMLVTIMTFVKHLPDWAQSKGMNGQTLRWAMGGVLVAFIIGHMQIMGIVLSTKTVTVHGVDSTIRSDTRGKAVNNLLAWIDRNAKPGETISVVPEGAMINVLARRRSPNKYGFILPSDIMMWGEGNVEADFAAHPSDLLLIVHRDTAEYGARTFGVDYAQGVAQWIDRTYKPAALFGDMPTRWESESQFGILAMRRLTGGAREEK